MSRSPGETTATVPARRPTIGLYFPNRNHAHFLPDVLDRLVEQTVKPDEIVIVDDASEDDSLAVLDRYCRRLPMLRVDRNPTRQGASRTMQRLLSDSRTDFVICGSADDWLEPTFIERCISALAVAPNVPLVVSAYRTLDETSGRIVPHGPEDDLGMWYVPQEGPHHVSARRLRHLLRRRFVWLAGNASLIERRRFAALGYFDPALQWHGDWFALYGLALRDGFVALPEWLSMFRLRPDSFSRGIRDRRLQGQVCAAILARLSRPEFADLRSAFREGPAIFSPMFRDMLKQAGARRRDWDIARRMVCWWLGEVVMGRRPGALARLTRRRLRRPTR